MTLITDLHKLLLAIVGIVSLIVSASYYVHKSVSQLATKTDIALIQAALDDITGNGRMFQLRAGYTYVAEPVYSASDTITIVGQARRTPVGVGCVFESVIALFEDDRQAVLTGNYVGTYRQLGPDYTSIRSTFSKPTNLNAGRVVVTMQLTYSCHGTSVVENSDPISFILQE